jgi:formate/nitrite transporter FocA (FNT family)
MGNAKGMMQEAFSTASNSISSNPSTAVFTAFAAGMGLGLGLALCFGGTSSPPPGMREQFTQFLNEHMPSWARTS